MKLYIKNVENVKIKGEYIRLDSFLKFISLTGTGGEAKARIQNGEVYVDGTICTMRGKKLKNGSIVRLEGQIFCVVSECLQNST